MFRVTVSTCMEASVIVVVVMVVVDALCEIHKLEVM